MVSQLFSSPTCFSIGELAAPGISSIILASFSLAIVTIVLLKKYDFSTKSKLSLIYAHLALLFFPVMLLSTQTTCGILCAACANHIGTLVLYALPPTLVASTITGFMVIPTFFLFTHRKKELKTAGLKAFLTMHARALNIHAPKVYAVNKGEPLAFSFRFLKAAIFISAGLLELVNTKELEAIVLHELFHIKRRSSTMKFSTHIIRVFSPLSLVTRFSHDSSREEDEADAFVVKVQKTPKHLKSAKQKIAEAS